jgi:demethylmenaquinone methyltransferase/2-methoxy-6-polyprenyl-1,4-benzoquinol methylase
MCAYAATGLLISILAVLLRSNCSNGIHIHVYASYPCNLQGLLLENMVVPAARQLGLEAEYAYLRPSIKRFPQGV